MKFENTEVFNFEGAFRGLRNPLESWDKSDSIYCLMNEDMDCHICKLTQTQCNSMINHSGGSFLIGENDLKLAQKLVKAGSEHSKFTRQIFVSVDITAPLYWWSEFDTYSVGVTKNSTSFMHKGMSTPFNIKQFEIDNKDNKDVLSFDVECDIPTNLEIYKSIDNFSNYEISNTGKVKNIITNKIISQCVNSSNYKKVILTNEGKERKNLYVHRLIALKFIENPQNLPIVNHKDGNKWNNNISNLEWVTHKENDSHAVKLGLKKVSTYNRYRVGKTTRRFGFDEVKEIKLLFEKGISKKEISIIFNCYDSIICNILNGKLYKEIELSPKDILQITIDTMNDLREQYFLEEDLQKKQMIWRSILQIRPSSWLQTRTCTLNYQVLRNIYFQRKNHKLKQEWVDGFCKWVETLPYSNELITIKKQEV